MNDIRPRYRRRSLFGPLLVAGIGIFFLLRNMGVIHNSVWWFRRYWPLLFIFWGIVKFGEYLWARNHNQPYSGVGVSGIVFLVLFGLVATGVTRVHWGVINLDGDDDWGWGFFNTRYDFTENFATPMPTGREVRILSTYGDITITPSPDDQAHVFVHKYVRGDSQEDANKFNAATHPKFEQQGSVWLLDLTGGSFADGRLNLEVQVPAKYAVSLVNRHGDIRISQMQADLDLETNHGDLTIEQIKGNAVLRSHHGDVTAKNVTGNVNVSGSVDDSVFSDITGTLTMTGTYTGDIQLSRVSSPVKFNSSRTDLQMAKLDGDLTMDGSDLKANLVAGPFILRTDAKDVRLDNITGDVHIDNRSGDVALQAGTPLGNVDVSTTGGEITVALPEKPGFQMDAQSDGGEIHSDFSLNINDDHHSSTATGTVGKGGPQVKLKTSRGTIQIKRN